MTKALYSGLRWVASQLAKRGEIKVALDAVRTIQDGSERAAALRAIASDLLEGGKIPQALEVAGAIEDASERADALRAIAENS